MTVMDTALDDLGRLGGLVRRTALGGPGAPGGLAGRTVLGDPGMPGGLDRRTALDDLGRLGGLARRTALRELGHSDRALSKMLADGQAYPLRRVWLANADAPRDAMRAIQLGGVLGGESALRSWGVWVSRDTGLYVAAPGTASRLAPLANGEHRIQQRHFNWPAGWRTGVADALAAHVVRAPAWHAVASLDSALQQQLLSRAELDELLRRLPRRFGRLGRLVDGRCESGLETLLRLAALGQGWRVEPQVYIRGVGRVDLLIAGRLVVEADGDAYHSSPQQRAKDRDRDAALVRQGLKCHRFGHRQVMNDLDGCVEVMRAHLFPR